MFSAMRNGFVYAPVYVKTLGCLSVPTFQMVNQGNADADKTDPVRPPPGLFSSIPAPPVSEVPSGASMIPKDILASSAVPNISVQTRSQGPEGASQVTPVTKGLYYTLTTINGVLDLSSPMSCPAEPHPTMAISATGTSCSDTAGPSSSVNELVIPPANATTATAIPLTVGNSYVIPQTESLPVFELQDGHLMVASPTSLSDSSSTASFLTLDSSSSCIPIPSSPVIQVVPSDLSMTSEPAESHCTSPIASSASSVINEALEDGDLPPSLAKAVETVAQTGSLTPLIKEELRYTIQNKRLLKGESELVVEPKKESSPKLSAEEEEKRSRRRERNKLAAQKCRGKRRLQMDSLEEETHRLEAHNSSLRKQMKTLEVEREKLTLLLRCHDTSLDMCPANQRMSGSECPVSVSEMEDLSRHHQGAAASSSRGGASNDVFMESSDTDSSCDDLLSVGTEEEAMSLMVVDGEVVIE